MTVDPRAALDRFVAALEAHYHAVATRRGEDDPAVDDAYDVLADAFEVYDDALATVHNEATPFYLVTTRRTRSSRTTRGRATTPATTTPTWTTTTLDRLSGDVDGSAALTPPR